MQLSPVACEPHWEGRIPISPLPTIPVPWGLFFSMQPFPAELWAELWGAEPVFGCLWQGMGSSPAALAACGCCAWNCPEFLFLINF